VANRYNLINEGSLEVGNTRGKPNGSEWWFYGVMD
jgi:hypothetical protein